MTRRTRLAAAFLAPLLLGAARAQDVAPPPAPPPVPVPDPNPFLFVVPEAARSGPPPWVRAGTRLTYFGMTASVPGERTQLVQDENGNWVDKGTGKKWGEQEIPGAGAAGFNVVEVGYVDHDVVLLSGKLYVIDTSTQTSMFSGGSGMVTNAGCAADYWVHPAVLAKIPDTSQPGLRILRMPYVVQGRRYDAIRFQTENEKGYQAHVYELATGRLVYYGSSTQGAGVLTPPIGGGGQAGVGRGSTQLVTTWIVEATDIDVPWRDSPTPRWVGEFRELTYECSQMSVVAGAGQFERGMRVTITPAARQPAWARYVGASVLQTYPGMPPEEGRTDGATGPASIGGLWIAPEALARLRRGQVISRHAHAQTETTVSEVGPGYVVITETGRRHRLDCTYDAGSGVLSGYSLQQQIGLSTITHRVRLTGRR